jgi:O-antigen/teichoic acid export membrane protein
VVARQAAVTQVVKPVFSAATPLVIHAILGLAIFNSDLIFLRALRDARTAGMYAAAYTLISFLLNLGVTYGSSILPALSRAHDDRPKQQSIYDQAMMQMLTVAIPIAVGGALLAGGLLELVFGPRYGEAVQPLQILMWSIVVAWVRNVVQMGLIARDQQAFILRTTIWSAATNALFNLLLIPSYGMIGAAVATLVTEGIRTLVAMWYSVRRAWVRCCCSSRSRTYYWRCSRGRLCTEPCS